jgi:hypothetical protein
MEAERVTLREQGRPQVRRPCLEKAGLGKEHLAGESSEGRNAIFLELSKGMYNYEPLNGHLTRQNK